MMARKKTTDDSETETEQKPKATPHKDAVISQSKLTSLMKAKRGATKDTAEINGQLGNLIREAVENNHLHRKAFSTICVLDKMENEKIADFLMHFEYYLDISGIKKRADAVMKMPLEDGDEGDGNVHPFPGQAAAE